MGNYSVDWKLGEQRLPGNASPASHVISPDSHMKEAPSSKAGIINQNKKDGSENQEEIFDFAEIKTGVFRRGRIVHPAYGGKPNE